MKLEIEDMVKEHKFTIRTTKEELARWDKFAKDHGQTSVAKLIREGLRVLEQNPHFLDPTQNPYLASIREGYLEYRKEAQDFEKYIQAMDERITQIERDGSDTKAILEKFVLKGKPLTKKELKEAKKKDLSSEAVFE